MRSDSLFDKRFIINSGKGGVGKTTVSAAMALAFAQQGKRVLLMQLNAHDKLGAIFGQPPVGTAIRELAPHVYAVNTTPQDAMQEYALMILRVKVLYKAVFENKVVAKFLRAVPGLPELVMLGKAYFHEQEKDEAGRPKWDAIIIDAPATGHGMFLLQIPQVITGAIKSGRMATESQQILDLLRDRKRTAINLVTLTEEMPVNETIEYRRRLREEIDIGVGAVVANGIYPRIFTDQEAAQLEQLRDTYGRESDDLGRILAAGAFRHARCELQSGYLGRLRRDLALPLIEIPFYFEPELDRSVLERMAAHIGESVRLAERSR